jgi:Spy/CpxP family protein refolding chaperone
LTFKLNRNENGGKKMNKLGKIIVVVAIIGIVGYAATSFAGRGRGWGCGGNCWGQGGGGNCWGQGGGWNQRGSAAPGSQGNLSEQEIEQLQTARQAFFEETRELRDNLHRKELELRSEMAKENPDVEKAVALQKALSELRGQLAQKRIEHRIKMRKENPGYFAGGGYGRGYGYGPRGMGQGRGYGGRCGGCTY